MTSRIPLVIYSESQLALLVRKRKGETRLGELTGFLPGNDNMNLSERLSHSPCRYVLLGIPEDVGIRANMGRGGAYSAWQPSLNTLMNVQSNNRLTGSELLVLGHFDCTAVMDDLKDVSFRDDGDYIKARKLVSEIDEAVYPIIETIIASGKEPVIIGGGHNNAYPVIKGAASAMKGKSKINVLNCDAHADLRPLEGRHSGNAFSYAIEDGYLDKYAVIGLHEIFNMASVLSKFDAEPERYKATFIEDLFIRNDKSWHTAVEESMQFVSDGYTGLELDLDVIQNIPASAKTSSSISTIQARQYVHTVASACRTLYFHLPEAAPVLSHLKTDLKTGKLIAYLVTDYIKARNIWYKNHPA